MGAVAVDELKRNLDIYLRKASEGETVLVSEAGRIVAQILPAPEVPAWIDEEPGLATLVRAGRVALPAMTEQGPPPNIPNEGITLDRILRDLDSDRADSSC